MRTADSGNTDLWWLSIAGGEARPLGLGLGKQQIDEPRMHPDGRRFSFVVSRKSWEAWSLEDFLPKAH